jgi:integrase
MAARTLNKLNDIAIRKASQPALLSDGGKLYLRVTSASQKSWVFLFQWAGKGREMGLGSLRDVSLAQARVLRAAQVELLAKGINPIEAREATRAALAAKAAAPATLTLEKAAPMVLAVSGINTVKGRTNFLRSVQVHSGAMAKMALAAITTEDVLAALEPLWTTQPETADRMRKRVETVLDWAFAKGLIAAPWSNPARWGVLRFLTAKRAVTVEHRASMSYRAAGGFMATLRGLERRPVIWALEFVNLTLARNSEGRLADWSELNRDAAAWVCPAARMKMRKAHRVPLSSAAVALLDEIAGGDVWPAAGWVFPSQWKPGRAVSETSLLRVLNDIDPVATVHGIRATFKDWSLDVGGVSERIGEECLAHVVGSKTRNAYRRDDGLEARRPVMQAWADFLAVTWVDNVVPLSSGRAAA